MGASDFTEYIQRADPDQAFSEGTRRAGHEHGHGGYSGTLAEKGSFTIITRMPVSKAQAYRLSSQLIEQDDRRISDKWGPAGAIPVAEAATRSIEVTLTIPGSFGHQDRATWEPLVAAKVKAKGNEEIVDVRPKVQDTKVKVTAVATAGQPVTRYFATAQGYNNGAWDKGHPTQAAARAAAVEALSNGRTYGDGYDIQAITRRENGEPLVRVRRVVTRSTAVVTVDLATVPAPGSPVIGWLFFGFASS